MMSPLKLSVIVCGAAAGLAVAPYVVKQILPPVGAVDVTSAMPTPSDALSVKVDLPVAGANEGNNVVPSLALSGPVKEEAPARPELRLPAPALPTPAATQVAARIEPAVELALPSLASVEIASAMPTPSFTPAPTPVPTPEIPYRAEVETAQKLMRDLSLNTGKIDGKLGPNTKTALRNFQEKEGLAPSGEVTPDLLSRMKKAVAALPAPTPAPTPSPEIIITDARKTKDAVETDSLKSIAKADAPDAVVVRKVESAAAIAKPKIDPGPVPNLRSRKNVSKLQEQLKEAGTYAGNVDGKWGDLTRSAMREFQEKKGIEVTGKPNKETWLAMHSDVSVPAKPKSKPDETVKTSAVAAVAFAGDMKISSVDSEIEASASVVKDEETIVNVNGDGVSTPDSAKPIATPSAVSDFSKKPETKKKSEELADSSENDSFPTVKVSAPNRDSEQANDTTADSEAPSDLAVAEFDRDGQMEKLRKEIEDKRAQINLVSNDSTYEVKKYAPKMLETVNTMVDDLKIESVSNDPAEARVRLAKIDEELEKAKSESMKKKAGEMVADVRGAYNELKEHFPERIKSLSLKNDEEKTRREELTELVAKCDVGFEAMSKDFEKGKYTPIFENAVNFSATIQDISTDVAEVYVEKKLEQKDVKRKLKKDDLKEIKALQDDENHVKAAEILDDRASSGSSKNS